MNKAIKLAIEKGGYEVSTYPNSKITKIEADPVLPRTNIWYDTGHFAYVYNNDVVLSPLFWKALGKALGWKEEIEVRSALGTKAPWPIYDALYAQAFAGRIFIPESEYHAYRYLHCKLTGGDEEKFWKELIN